MIPWAWAHEHDWIYNELLHYVWHDAVRGIAGPSRSIPKVPKSEIKIGSWDNNCGAVLEQLWAIREGLAENPENR